MFHNLKTQREMINLGDKFESLYLEYGGDKELIEKYKSQEVERKMAEVKELLPKIPNSIKRRFKVK